MASRRHANITLDRFAKMIKSSTFTPDYLSRLDDKRFPENLPRALASFMQLQSHAQMVISPNLVWYSHAGRGAARILESAWYISKQQGSIEGVVGINWGPNADYSISVELTAGDNNPEGSAERNLPIERLAAYVERELGIPKGNIQ